MDLAVPTTADGSSILTWKRKTTGPNGEQKTKTTELKMPTLDELLNATFKERRHLLFPWLREQESCMVYADTGAGKSLFALSAALAVAGGGEFLGWNSEAKDDGNGWRVLYIDGEMHITDVQERAAMLIDAVPEIDKVMAGRNLRFLARQHQEPGTDFPLITEPDGVRFVLDRIRSGHLDLVILDNFSTLGEVEDENAASSFNAIQQFLLQLKTAGVATMLIHHAGKNGDFRGSSKLAATFETIIKLERNREEATQGEAQFRVCWDKVRAGGPNKTVREVMAKLKTRDADTFGGEDQTIWEYEAADLDRLDDIRERLRAGEFKYLKEIADLYGVSRTMITKYVDKGKQLGLWTQQDVNRWIVKGKNLRNLGKTEAPIRPATEGELWGDEDESEENEDF